MELFREDGCLSEEGLHAVVEQRLDEMGRLEAAEHLAYCDRCLDRYTALLTQDALEQPPRDVSRTVMYTVWTRVMQNIYGRIAIAGVAAVLALTMWRGGAFEAILSGEEYLPKRPVQEPPPTTIGQMLEPSALDQAYDKLFEVWDSLIYSGRKAQTDKTNQARK